MSEDDYTTKEKADSAKLRHLEYCYCRNCETIRYDFQLAATPSGIRCTICGSSELVPPAWIECPHRKGAVKCTAGGTGLVRERTGYKCLDRCRFLIK